MKVMAAFSLRYWLCILVSILVVESSMAQSNQEILKLKKGDVITQINSDGDWKVVKVLEVDQWPDDSLVAHCLTYQSVATKPTLEEIKSLDVFAYHAPIDAASFQLGWELLGNQAPSSEELIGFIEYLRLTDFQRYATVTNQKLDELIAEANKNYKKGYELSEEKRFQEAIQHYSRAVDIFPLFYEAVDNRAFVYMDMGEYEIALGGFEESLAINPDGVTAFFSRGECLLKLGRLEEASYVFEEGISKFPENAQLFEEFYRKSKSLLKP